jgi:NAD-dependent dihydropyrimidine dehydrogenase PreA subunit
MIELPAVDLTRCRAAGDCVRACPVSCLEMAAGAPWLARPADCLSCGLCALVCPYDALIMTAVAPEEE